MKQLRWLDTWPVWGRLLVTAGLAAAVMAGVTVGALTAMQAVAPGTGLLARLAVVVVPTLAGGAVYVGLVSLLGVEEINLLWAAVRRRLGPGGADKPVA